MRRATVVFAIISTTATASASTQDVENCSNQIAGAARHAAALAAFDPDGESSAFDDHVRDFNDGLEQARLCVSKLPAGADRTRLASEYDQLRATARGQERTSIETFRAFVGFKRDIAQLYRRIDSAPPGGDYEGDVAALLDRIGRSDNPYATEAWRLRQRASFDKLLAAHHRARSAAEANARRTRIERNTVLARHPGSFTSVGSENSDLTDSGNSGHSGSSSDDRGPSIAPTSSRGEARNDRHGQKTRSPGPAARRAQPGRDGQAGRRLAKKRASPRR